MKRKNSRFGTKKAAVAGPDFSIAPRWRPRCQICPNHGTYVEGPETLNQANGGAQHEKYRRYIQKYNKEKERYPNIAHLPIWHLAIAHIGDVDGQIPDARWTDKGQIHMIYNLRCYLYVEMMLWACREACNVTF